MSPRRPVIFDCDPGVDDAVALLLACAASEELDLLGIATVAGNVSAALTARNACLIREIAGRSDVPVHAGAQRPLRREPVEAGHFHGASGLGDLPIGEPREGVTPGHAVDFIATTLRTAVHSGRKVSIVITGPMTNVALALQRDPRLLEGVECFAVMGGARSEGGNITASSEYNVHADPDAAHYVFNAGPVVYAFGLDATHQVRATPARTTHLHALGSPSARAAARLLDFANALPANGPREHGAPLHDPCPIAWLLAPQLFRFKPCHIDVEVDSRLTLGHTAVEFRASGECAQNVQWAIEADADGVFALLEHYFAAGRSGKA
jgi:purine nucleosidase